MVELMLWNMTEQEETMVEITRIRARIPPTIRKAFLCLAMNSPTFFVSSADFFAAFAVVSDALAVFSAPLPAFAAAYSFLIARFCCHLE